MTLRSDVGRRRRWHTRGVLDFVVLADTEGNRFCVIDTGRG
jgi:hypothetical protein